MNAGPITRLNAALEGRYRVEREIGEGGMATVSEIQFPGKRMRIGRPIVILLAPLLTALVLACPLSAQQPSPSPCLDTGIQVQILGSGGPGNAAGRASSAYLVWIDGTSRIMVDAGGGTKDQFHQSGASFADMGLLALSHLHPDHSAELPALLWPGGADLRVSGPTGNGVFPSLDEFLDRLFGPNGAFRVLSNRIQLGPVNTI